MLLNGSLEDSESVSSDDDIATESDLETTPVPLQNTQIIELSLTVLQQMKIASLGCFGEKDSATVLPLDGLVFGVFALYSGLEDHLITSCKLLGHLNVIDSTFVKLKSLSDQEKGNFIGLGFTSFIFSEIVPTDIFELIKSCLVNELDTQVEFLAFYDVLSDHYSIECFNYDSCTPILFNIFN